MIQPLENYLKLIGDGVILQNEFHHLEKELNKIKFLCAFHVLQKYLTELANDSGLLPDLRARFKVKKDLGVMQLIYLSCETFVDGYKGVNLTPTQMLSYHKVDTIVPTLSNSLITTYKENFGPVLTKEVIIDFKKFNPNEFTNEILSLELKKEYETSLLKLELDTALSSSGKIKTKMKV